MDNWQIGVIIPTHHNVCKDVERYDGRRIRIGPPPEHDPIFREWELRYRVGTGCDGQIYLVHPEDAESLWPHEKYGLDFIFLCSHDISID